MTEFRSGTIDVLVPRHLTDRERRDLIHQRVQGQLTKTGEWAVRIDAPSGFGVDDHLMKWPAHFTTGPVGSFEE